MDDKDEKIKEEWLWFFFTDFKRTKRALWLARAVSAFHISENKESYDDYCDIQCERHNTLKFIPSVSESEWYKRWENVERKCRERAEEYK